MESTPWLNDDEQQAWRTHLQATRLLLTAIEAQLQRDANLSHTDFEILARLSEAPGRRLRMSHLAEALRFSRSRISHAIDRLAHAGWIVRESYPGDGRGTIALLTDEGWDKLVATAPGHVRAVREYLIDLLTPQQLAQLQDISTVVRDQASPAYDKKPAE